MALLQYKWETFEKEKWKIFTSSQRFCREGGVGETSRHHREYIGVPPLSSEQLNWWGHMQRGRVTQVKLTRTSFTSYRIYFSSEVGRTKLKRFQKTHARQKRGVDFTWLLQACEVKKGAVAVHPYGFFDQNITQKLCLDLRRLCQRLWKGQNSNKPSNPSSFQSSCSVFSLGLCIV